jgi:hypothetical protein
MPATRTLPSHYLWLPPERGYVPCRVPNPRRASLPESAAASWVTTAPKRPPWRAETRRAIIWHFERS